MRASRPLDLEKLKRRLDGQHRMMRDEIKHVLKCSKYGGKELGMTRQPNTTGRVPPGGDRNCAARCVSDRDVRHLSWNQEVRRWSHSSRRASCDEGGSVIAPSGCSRRTALRPDLDGIEDETLDDVARSS
jgi:hypothetical protein